MKSSKAIKHSLLNFLPKFARKIGQKSVVGTCLWWLHQPEIPAGMKKEK